MAKWDVILIQNISTQRRYAEFIPFSADRPQYLIAWDHTL